ncbi:MAG: hypothetical protein WCW61_01920 [Patescibacteria group bacterium]|jgi:uncharacterized protein YxeA
MKKIVFFIILVVSILISNVALANTATNHKHKTEFKKNNKKHKKVSKKKKLRQIRRSQKKAYADRDCHKKTVKRTPNNLW